MLIVNIRPYRLAHLPIRCLFSNCLIPPSITLLVPFLALVTLSGSGFNHVLQIALQLNQELSFSCHQFPHFKFVAIIA